MCSLRTDRSTLILTSLCRGPSSSFPLQEKSTFFEGWRWQQDTPKLHVKLDYHYDYQYQNALQNVFPIPFHISERFLQKNKTKHEIKKKTSEEQQNQTCKKEKPNTPHRTEQNRTEQNKMQKVKQAN